MVIANVRREEERTGDEEFDLIDQVAELQPRVFVITGGDPLKREDTYDMIRHAKDRGLEPSLTPSATPLLTEGAIARMKQHDLARLALSLDFLLCRAPRRFSSRQGIIRSQVNTLTVYA